MLCPQCKNNIPQGQTDCDECGFILAPVQNTSSGSFYNPPSGGSQSNPQTTQTQTGRVACDSEQCLKQKLTAPVTATYCSYCQNLLPLPVGATLNNGRWVILSIIGRGGMGRIYCAKDNQTNSEVVVKELLDEQGRPQIEKEVYLDHFKNESQVLGSVKQVRAVPELIYDYTVEGSRHYFVMEFIDGVDLGDLVKKKAGFLEVKQVIQYGINICEVLEILHQRNPPIVHRDIKPDNMRLRTSNNSVALLDFGVARNVREGTKLTKLGTPGYVSPEQARGAAEPRSDLYSLAASLYSLLSYVIPEDDLSKKPGTLRQINSQVTSDLEAIILANLHDSPNERYSSATELKQDLRQGKMTQTIPCPQCKTLNHRNLIYCTNDGMLLNNQSRQCANSSCRNLIPFRAKFCPHCGSKQS